MTYQEAEEIIEDSCKFGLRIKKTALVIGRAGEFINGFLDSSNYNIPFHICNKNKSGLYFQKGDRLYKSNLKLGIAD